MAYLTDYQYYENSGTAPTNTNHGAYQNVKLSDLVNNYMLNYVGEDLVVDNVPRHRVIYQIKQCIKNLNYDAVKGAKVIEAEIDDELKMVMPSNYVDYIRISRMEDGVLFPMSENRQAFRADAYLRDNNNELTFDGDGGVLLTSSQLEADRIADIPGSANITDCYYQYTVGANFGLDTSRATGNPTFRVNREYGVIDFDSTMSGKTIVIEYVSDGMEGGDDTLIGINKFFEEYLYAYVTSELLDKKYGVTDVDRTRWRQKKRALYGNARIRIGIKPGRMLMLLRGQNKWIK